MGRKIMRMSRDFFRGLFDEGEHHYRVIGNPLPPDTAIVDISPHVFFAADDLAIKLESAEWPEVAAGDPLPLVANVILQRMDPPKSWRDNPQL